MTHYFSTCHPVMIFVLWRDRQADEQILQVKRLRTENVNMFSVLEENKSLRQQLEKTTEKVSHDVLVEVMRPLLLCYFMHQHELFRITANCARPFVS